MFVSSAGIAAAMCSPDGMTVHVIDDDSAVRESLEALLVISGYDVQTYDSAEDFLARVPQHSGCLVLDVNMPGMSGLELLRRLSDQGRQSPVVMLTARRDDGVRDQAHALGALGFLVKPASGDDLLRAIVEAGSAFSAAAAHTGDSL